MLVFFLIVAMDRPFAGKESISAAPFELAIENMRRWNAEVMGASSQQRTVSDVCARRHTSGSVHAGRLLTCRSAGR
jgi:hypothetical protein